MAKKMIIALYSLFACIPMSIQAETDDQPDLEFLEFLSEWQTDQGEWLDPLQMQDLAQDKYTAKSIEVAGDE